MQKAEGRRHLLPTEGRKCGMRSADCALNHVRFRALALNPTRFRAVMHPILNYIEFRTNHEPDVVHGVVHGGMRN